MILLRRTAPALACAVALLLLIGRPARVAAHPLGNFTINQYSRIEIEPDGLRLIYVLDMAEIPAFQEMALVDTDGDGTVGSAESDAYLTAKLAEIVPGLHLALNGAELPLHVAERTLTFPDGQAGLKLLRLEAVLTASLDSVVEQSSQVSYQNDFAADRLGWKEVVVTHAAGIRLDASDAPMTDLSNELRAYPDDLLSSPLDQTAASFAFALAPGAAAAPGFGATREAGDASRPGGGTSGARFAALLDGRELTAAGVAVSLLLAMLWGAMHALSPGHGKTVVGAYLVGSRGTAKHALFLGLTVTLTHTAGVFSLGLITLFASRYVVPDRLYPWMSLLSGLLVAVMGGTILWRRLTGRPGFGHHHDHDHEHHHEHTHTHDGHTHTHLPPGADGSRITWRNLLALGVSGGLLPCPSALVVLLGSIALERVGFGMALVLAFSLGLAGALTGVGLLFLYAGRLLERHVGAARWSGLALRYAPIGGALVVTIAGLAIVARSLGTTLG